jgi:hypothetical protein
MSGELTQLELTPGEVWLLYRLVAGELSGGPCLLDEPHARHRKAAGTVLAKLSDVALTLEKTEADRG